MPSGSLFIITGTSKGIGEALVRQVLNETEDRAIGIARSKSHLYHSNYHHIECDLGVIDEMLGKLDEIFPVGDFEKVTLINNAGWIGEIAHMGKLSHQSIRQIFEINTITPAVLMNEFVKRYGELQGVKKVVINISSGASSKAIDGWSGYSASKAALNMLTQAAQIESDMDQTGIRFFSVAPGVVDTEMQANIRNASSDGFSSLPKFIGLKESGQLSSPEFAAEKILYLIDNVEKFNGVIQDVRNF